MSRRLEREIARRLKEHGESAPPADLLARIQAEIPDSLGIGLDATANLREIRRPARRRAWLLAASLAAMFGAGVLSYRLFETDRALDSGPPPSREETAPAAAPATPPRIAPPPPANRPAAPRALPAAPPPPAAALQGGSVKKQRAPERESPSLAVEEPAGAAAGEVAGGVAGGVPGGAPGGELAGALPPVEPAPAPAAPTAPALGGRAGLEAKEEPRLAQKPAPSAAPASPALADRADRADRAAPAPPQAKSAFAEPERFRSTAKMAAPAPAPPAEGAPSPFAGEGRRIVLLLLPASPQTEVTFDPAVVSHTRRSGPAGPGVLYEVELRVGAPAESVVAGRNGEPLLRVRDLAPSFERASAGFRLAALEAEAAALEAGTRPKSDLPELRRLARALAAELPADRRAAALLSRLERLSP